MLYGHRRSGSLAVELALAEIGADDEVRNIDLATEAQRDDTCAAVNPQRKIPALVTPAGETLTESVAILLTLEARHPDAGLLPQDQAARAQALRWLLLVATEIYPMVEINDYPERFAPTPNVAPGVREVALEVACAQADRRGRNRRRPVFIVVRVLPHGPLHRRRQPLGTARCMASGQSSQSGSVDGGGEQTTG